MVVVSVIVEKAVKVGDAWVIVAVSVEVDVARGILVLMQEQPAEMRSDLKAAIADLKGTAGVAYG